MTLEEAIQHCKEVAKENRKTALEYARAYAWDTAHGCRECANEHEQLVAWLSELKQLREDANRQRKTNANRIRQMSDEELAEWLDCETETGCNVCSKHPTQCDVNCYSGYLEWLKKEADG